MRCRGLYLGDVAFLGRAVAVTGHLAVRGFHRHRVAGLLEVLLVLAGEFASFVCVVVGHRTIQFCHFVHEPLIVRSPLQGTDQFPVRGGVLVGVLCEDAQHLEAALFRNVLAMLVDDLLGGVGHRLDLWKVDVSVNPLLPRF